MATTVALMPDPAARTHVARVDLSPVPVSNSPLFEAIPNRHTNRAAFESRPVAQGTLDALTGQVDVPVVEVVWFTRASDKRAFGDLIVRATETIIADRQQAIDDFAWYRGTWGEIQSKKDGVTSDAAGLPPLIRTLAKLIPASRAQNDDSWLKATRDTQVPTAAAFGTLVVRDPRDPVQRLQAGRIWQRMHLWATTKGLAMQPLNQVEERMDRERGRDRPRGDQSGRAKASSRGSVMSSIDQRSPSRPSPESFTPPYGIGSVRQVGMSLTMIPPTSSSSWASSVRSRSLVKTPHCNPNWLSLICAIASAKSATGKRLTTGAKTSSPQTLASFGTSTRTVGG